MFDRFARSHIMRPLCSLRSHGALRRAGWTRTRARGAPARLCISIMHRSVGGSERCACVLRRYAACPSRAQRTWAAHASDPCRRRSCVAGGIDRWMAVAAAGDACSAPSVPRARTPHARNAAVPRMSAKQRHHGGVLIRDATKDDDAFRTAAPLARSRISARTGAPLVCAQPRCACSCSNRKKARTFSVVRKTDGAASV